MHEHGRQKRARTDAGPMDTSPVNVQSDFSDLVMDECVGMGPFEGGGDKDGAGALKIMTPTSMHNLTEATRSCSLSTTRSKEKMDLDRQSAVLICDPPYHLHLDFPRDATGLLMWPRHGEPSQRFLAQLVRHGGYVAQGSNTQTNDKNRDGEKPTQDQLEFRQHPPRAAQQDGGGWA